jgi:hypothetical protein
VSNESFDRAVVEAFRQTPEIRLEVPTIGLMALIGTAQLGLRHPALQEGGLGSGAAAARKFIADIRSQLPPALQLLIDCGFDRRYERPISFGQNRGGAPVLEGPSTSASSLARRPDDPQE